LGGCLDIPDDDQCRRRRNEHAYYPRRSCRTDSHNLPIHFDIMFCYFRDVWLVSPLSQSHFPRHCARLEQAENTLKTVFIPTIFCRKSDPRRPPKWTLDQYLTEAILSCSLSKLYSPISYVIFTVTDSVCSPPEIDVAISAAALSI